MLASLQDALGARYSVEELIGRGGMAAVYRATDHQLHRTVAVKVLSPDLGPMLGEARFHREIEYVAGLQHPGIVPLFEAGHQDGLYYYIMPFVEGETLRTRLERDRQLPVALATRFAIDIADALCHAHAHGIVHRDIKPENILLTGEHAQVADFGIAHAISLVDNDRLTSGSIALGTPAYMSPEQVTGDATIDGRADVYSLGCVLYEMLTGQPPFGGATPQAVMSRHVAERIPSIRVVRPGVASAVERAVDASLAKVPADRPDAAGFLRMLHGAEADPARGEHPERVSRWLLIAVALLIVVGVGYVLIKPSAALDGNAVVVFPMSSPGRASDGNGELVAQLVGSTLEHTEPLRWIAGWSELDPATRADPSTLTSDAAARLTRQLGARWYVEGALLPFSDSLTVTLRLHDVESDSVYQQSTTGHAGGDPVHTATVLAQRALVPLLAMLVGPSRHVDLAFLRDRNPAAIALWLQGEQQKRAANFRDAYHYYSRALDLDSTLAVAALTAAGVALWIGEPDATAGRLAELALRHSEGLPPRNLAFTRGMIAYAAQDADSAVAFFQKTIAADSLWPEGWMMLGDSYHHLLPSRPVNTDSLAEISFRRTVTLDPGFSPGLFHLAQLLLRRGELGEGERLLARFRAGTTDSLLAPQLEMMLACQRDGTDAVDWRANAARVPLRVLGVVADLGAGAARPDCATAAADALLAAPTDSVPLAIRWAALKWLHHWAIARGDLGAARALIDSGVATVHPAAQILHIVDAALAGADTVAARRVIGMLPETGSMEFDEWVWLPAIWAVYQRDGTALDAFVDRFGVGARAGVREARMLADAFGARQQLAAGDTTAAIAMLTRMQAAPGDLLWGIWEAGAPERLLLAQLLLATGKPDAARAAAATLDGAQSASFMYVLPASLVVRIGAAEQLGDARASALLRERLRRIGRTDLL